MELSAVHLMIIKHIPESGVYICSYSAIQNGATLYRQWNVDLFDSIFGYELVDYKQYISLNISTPLYKNASNELDLKLYGSLYVTVDDELAINLGDGLATTLDDKLAIYYDVNSGLYVDAQDEKLKVGINSIFLRFDANGDITLNTIDNFTPTDSYGYLKQVYDSVTDTWAIIWDTMPEGTVEAPGETDVPLVDVGDGMIGTAGKYATFDHQHPLNTDATNPANIGAASAAAGTSGIYADRAHVHKIQGSGTGAGTTISINGITFTVMEVYVPYNSGGVVWFKPMHILAYDVSGTPWDGGLWS